MPKPFLFRKVLFLLRCCYCCLFVGFFWWFFLFVCCFFFLSCVFWGLFSTLWMYEASVLNFIDIFATPFTYFLKIMKLKISHWFSPNFLQGFFLILPFLEFFLLVASSTSRITTFLYHVGLFSQWQSRWLKSPKQTLSLWWAAYIKLHPLDRCSWWSASSYTVVPILLPFPLLTFFHQVNVMI